MPLSPKQNTLDILANLNEINYMKHIIVGDYKVHREGSRLIVHAASCTEEGCDLHDATVTRRQLKSILAKKAERVADRSIEYRKSGIKIGCTSIKYATLNRIAKLLD